MRLIISRHGQTEWNALQRTQGMTDIALTPKGIWQAERLARRLEKCNIDIICTSPLRRALDSAQIIAGAIGLNAVSVDDRLREHAFGAWEGLTFNEIREQYPRQLERWNSDPEDCPIPDGEGIASVRNRVREFIEELKKQYFDQTVLVVSHAMPIKLIIADAIGLATGRMHHLSVENMTFTMMAYYKERTVLKVLNDGAHLMEAR